MSGGGGGVASCRCSSATAVTVSLISNNVDISIVFTEMGWANVNSN